MFCPAKFFLERLISRKTSQGFASLKWCDYLHVGATFWKRPRNHPTKHFTPPFWCSFTLGVIKNGSANASMTGSRFFLNLWLVCISLVQLWMLFNLLHPGSLKRFARLCRQAAFLGSVKGIGWVNGFCFHDDSKEACAQGNLFSSVFMAILERLPFLKEVCTWACLLEWGHVRPYAHSCAWNSFIFIHVIFFIY